MSSSSRPRRSTTKTQKGKDKVSVSRQPPPIYDTSSDSEEIEQDVEIDYTNAPRNVTSTQLHEAHEKDFRPIFESGIGELITTLVTGHGWEKLLGSSTWFVNEEYVNWFRRHICGTNPKRTSLVWKTGDGRVHQRTLTPAFLSQFTGIPPVEDYTWSFLEEFESRLNRSHALEIAPYHDKDAHFDGVSNSLKVKGMQANVMSLTKWVAVNIIGTYTTHVIHGRVAWMVENLLYNSFPAGFDIHCVLAIVLRGHMLSAGEKRASCPLPALASAIAAKCLRKDPIASIPKPQGQRFLTSYKSDITGLYDGTFYPSGDPRRPKFVLDGDGANLRYIFEKTKKRKGNPENAPAIVENLGATPHPLTPIHTTTSPPPFIPPSTPTHVFQTGGSSTSVFSEPFQNTVPFTAYSTPGFISEYQIQAQNSMIWNQNAVMRQELSALLTHLSVTPPAYPGFAAPGFPSYVQPAAEHVDNNTGVNETLDEDA